MIEPSANSEVANQTAQIIATIATMAFLIGFPVALLLLRLLAALRKRFRRAPSVEMEKGQGEREDG